MIKFINDFLPFLLKDLEREIMEEKQKQELDAQNRGAWNEVDIDEKPAEISVCIYFLFK